MAAAAVAPAAAAGLAEVSLARSDYSELMEEKSYFHRKGIPESSRSGGGTSACTARSRDSVLDGLLSLRDVHVSQQLSQSSTWPSEANGVWPTLTEFSGLPSEVDLRGRESSLSGAVTPPWPSLHPSDKGAMDEGDDDDDAHAADRLAELDEQVGRPLQPPMSMVWKPSKRWNKPPRLAYSHRLKSHSWTPSLRHRSSPCSMASATACDARMHPYTRWNHPGCASTAHTFLISPSHVVQCEGGHRGTSSLASELYTVTRERPCERLHRCVACDERYVENRREGC